MLKEKENEINSAATPEQPRKETNNEDLVRTSCLVVFVRRSILLVLPSNMFPWCCKFAQVMLQTSLELGEAQKQAIGVHRHFPDPRGVLWKYRVRVDRGVYFACRDAVTCFPFAFILFRCVRIISFGWDL